MVEKCLRDNDYPQKFISNYKETRKKGVKFATVEKKSTFLQLSLKGDKKASMINSRLSAPLKRTCPAAKLFSMHQTNSTSRRKKVGKSPLPVTSDRTYQFASSCQSIHFERTERRIHDRISEYIPQKIKIKKSTYFQQCHGLIF